MSDRGTKCTLSLTGRGVLVAVLDSGVDIQHPEFLNPDGSTRIAALWDQTSTGDYPVLEYGRASFGEGDEFLDCYNAEHDAELMEKGIILEGKQIS